MKNVLNERGVSSSLCSLRPGAQKCCDGVDLECFGCNPTHPFNCVEPYSDCFCDSSCILFEDCCSDHMDTCKDFYDEVNEYCSFHMALQDAAPNGIFVTCQWGDDGDGSGEQSFSCSSSEGEQFSEFTGSSLKSFIAWVNSDECKPKCDR